MWHRVDGRERGNNGAAILRRLRIKENLDFPAVFVCSHLWTSLSAMSPLQGCPSVEKPGEPKVRGQTSDQRVFSVSEW